MVKKKIIEQVLGVDKREDLNLQNYNRHNYEKDVIPITISLLFYPLHLMQKFSIFENKELERG